MLQIIAQNQLLLGIFLCLIMNVVDLMHYYKSNGIIINKKKKWKEVGTDFEIRFYPFIQT